MMMKKCPYCAEEVKAEAKKCKHCGEILDKKLKLKRTKEQKSLLPRERKWSPGVAALLSFIIPGVGQMYKGNILSGIFWFVFVVLGYLFFFVPGLILHVICIITAASGDPYK